MAEQGRAGQGSTVHACMPQQCVGAWAQQCSNAQLPGPSQPNLTPLPHRPPHLHRLVHRQVAVGTVQQRGLVLLLLLRLLPLPPRFLGRQLHSVQPVGGALLRPLVALRDGGAGAAKVADLRKRQARPGAK